MKKILILALSLGLFVSCSSDDGNSPDSDSENIYFPLTTGNYWTYDVSGTGVAVTTRDSLYVANDTVIGGTTYKKMKTRAIPTGFFSTSLRDNAVRKTGSSLVVRGESVLNLGGALPLNIALEDFVIFRENAASGSQLSSVANEISQDFGEYPLTLDYAMVSTAGETLATFTSNGITYNDVKAVRIVLNMQISTTVTVAGFSVDVPIMDSQDVIVSDMYFAKGIGMVKATTTISYNLEDFSAMGIELPIPPSSSVTQVETIDTYNVE